MEKFLHFCKSKFSFVVLHSICCIIIYHVASRKFYYTLMRKRERKEKYLSVIMKTVLTLIIPKGS